MREASRQGSRLGGWLGYVGGGAEGEERIE